MAFYNDEGFDDSQRTRAGRGTAVNRGEGTGSSVSTTSLSVPGLQSGDGGGYRPPNGNTGVSGYGQGGIQLPPTRSGGGTWGGGSYPGQQGGSGNAGGGYTPPNGNTGVSGYGQGGKKLPDFNGDYLGYIRSLLPGGTADRNALDSIEADLARVGITNQRASDGTSRGRVHLPNGNYVDLVHGSGWGDTWADLMERTPTAGGGSSSGYGDLAALLQAMFANQNTAAPAAAAPPPAAAASWPDTATPAPNVTQNGEVPPMLALQDQGLGRAMSALALRLPELIRSQPNNPLVQQLLAVMGGGY